MDKKRILQISLEGYIEELIKVLKNCITDEGFEILDKHILLLKNIKWIKEDLISLRDEGAVEQ